MFVRAASLVDRKLARGRRRHPFRGVAKRIALRLRTARCPGRRSVGAITFALNLSCGKCFLLRVTRKSARPDSAHSANERPPREEVR